MGKKLSEQDNELYKRVDEVLHYIWDPIGICDEPRARDEYYNYLPRVFSLLKSTENGHEITDYLVETERDTMGLVPSRDGAEKVTDILLAYREKIFENIS